MENNSGNWKKVESSNDFEWKKMNWCWNDKEPSIGFPLLILVIGIYWLGSELGYLPVPFSVWPVLFIVFGAYWLIKAVIKR